MQPYRSAENRYFLDATKPTSWEQKYQVSFIIHRPEYIIVKVKQVETINQITFMILRKKYLNSGEPKKFQVWLICPIFFVGGK